MSFQPSVTYAVEVTTGESLETYIGHETTWSPSETPWEAPKSSWESPETPWDLHRNALKRLETVLEIRWIHLKLPWRPLKPFWNFMKPLWHAYKSPLQNFSLHLWSHLKRFEIMKPPKTPRNPSETPWILLKFPLNPAKTFKALLKLS